MTDSTEKLAWWAEGSWTGVATTRAVMLLPPTVPQDLTERLWRLLRSEEASLTQALDEFVTGMGGRLGSIPDFALAVSAPDDMMHVALRGSAQLEVDGQALDASSVTTWLETACASPRSVVARSPERPGSVYRPVADAVVVAGALALSGDGDRGPGGFGGESGQAASGAGEQDDDADPERAPAGRLRRRSSAVSDQSYSRSFGLTGQDAGDQDAGGQDAGDRDAGAALTSALLGAVPGERADAMVSQDGDGPRFSAPDDAGSDGDASSDGTGAETVAAEVSTWAWEDRKGSGPAQETPEVAGEADQPTQASVLSRSSGGTAEVAAQKETGTSSEDSEDLADSAAGGADRGTGHGPGRGSVHDPDHGAQRGPGRSVPAQSERQRWAEAWTGEWTGAMHRLVRSRASGDLDGAPAKDEDGRQDRVRPGVLLDGAPATAATPSEAGVLSPGPVVTGLPGSGDGQGEEQPGSPGSDVDGLLGAVGVDGGVDGGVDSDVDEGVDGVTDDGAEGGTGGVIDGSAAVAPVGSDGDVSGDSGDDSGDDVRDDCDQQGGAGVPTDAAAAEERDGDHDGNTVSDPPEDLSHRLRDERVSQDEPAEEPTVLSPSTPWAGARREEVLSAGSTSQGEVAPRVARARPYGDHDGHTVSGLPEDLVSELISLVGSDVPGPAAADPVAPAPEPVPAPGSASVRVVLSAVCGNGHPNPTNYTTCRQCGADLNRPAKSVACPPLGRLIASSGESIDLDRPVLVGRSPSPTDVSTSSDAPVRVLTVPSPNQLVSRNHVLIDLDAWSVLAQDLGNCNGTVLTREGEAPLRLSSSAPVLLRSGDVLDVGDGQVLTFENLP